MILILGLGLGGNVFDDFMDRRKGQFTMYAVTRIGALTKRPSRVSLPS
jgi:hypothetical protein